MPHVPDLKPGETIEVSDNESSWYRATVVGLDLDGTVAIDTHGGRSLMRLTQWTHSRRPTPKVAKPWTAETFAPFWDHQFARINNLQTYGRVDFANNNGIWIEVHWPWERLQAKWLHRAGPSDAWQRCETVEGES